MLSLIPKSVLFSISLQIFEKVIIPLMRDYTAKTPNKTDDFVEDVIEYVISKLAGKV